MPVNSFASSYLSGLCPQEQFGNFRHQRCAKRCARRYSDTSACALRDKHYDGAQRLGHGEGYVYAHDMPDAIADQDYWASNVPTSNLAQEVGKQRWHSDWKRFARREKR